MKDSLSGGWIGWYVEVRDADGAKYLTVPVNSDGGDFSLAAA
jgi:hypothetical protein